MLGPNPEAVDVFFLKLSDRGCVGTLGFRAWG